VIAFLLYRLGEKSLAPSVGLFAAIWFSIYVQEIHFTSFMLRDVTVVMLTTFTCYLLIRYAHTMRGTLWTALAYAVLVHFDPQFLLFLPVITLYFLFYATRRRLLGVQYAFLFFGTVIVLLAPWTIRNYRVYGDPIPVALEATQYYQPVRSALTANAPADNGGGFWRNSVEYWRVMRLLDHTVGVANGPDRDLPAWSFRHNAISLATYGLLLPFFLVGVWVSVRNRNRTTLVLSIAVAGMYLIRAFYGGSPHTRLPAEPLIILLAFYGVTHIVREYRNRRARVDTGNSP
jgi:4-amino-4-deoxy-L-arabinose transferase-like glycosyltransferase